MNVWEKVLELLFPRRCPFCGKVTGGALLCDDCKSNLPVTDLQPVRDLTFARCAAPLYYEQSVRDALLDFKFHSRTGGLDCFGDLLAQCASACFAGEFDTVSWVPVSDKRRRQRGFDQSYELSCAVCRHWDTQPVATLRKTYHNRPQSGISAAEERRANVLGVYEPIPEHIWGRRILLVDDILTTGATLSECVRVLRENGAAEVVCLTLARKR